mgnify:CR=1 FL=1
MRGTICGALAVVRSAVSEIRFSTGALERMAREYKTLGDEAKKEKITIPLRACDLKRLRALAASLGKTPTETAREILVRRLIEDKVSAA